VTLGILREARLSQDCCAAAGIVNSIKPARDRMNRTEVVRQVI
jgi:hypothetical protein